MATHNQGGEMLNHHRLQCYALAHQLAQTVPALLGAWPTGTSYLQDQLKRALASVLLNIAEGNGRTGPLERKRFFTIARGSAAEVGAVLDVAQAFGLVTAEVYAHCRHPSCASSKCSRGFDSWDSLPSPSSSSSPLSSFGL